MISHLLLTKLLPNTCTEKPLKSYSNKFFSIYNYLFRSFFSIRFSMSIFQIESWKFKVESYFIFHFPFSILHCASALVEMMGFGLARTARSVFHGRERPPEVRSTPFPLRILAFVCNELISLFVTWWRWWDSNPWPPACRAGALPAELHPQINSEFIMQNSKLFKALLFSNCAFCILHYALRALRAGRPKWTRTTDLVLIRHAL